MPRAKENPMSLHLAGMALLLLTPAADAKPAASPRAGVLAEADEVAKLVGRDPAKGTPPFRILDTRTKAKYEAGHVPGAVWVDTAAWSKAFAAGQDPDEWARRLGEL